MHWSSCVRRSPFWCIKEIDYNYDDIGLYWGEIAGEELNEILTIGSGYIDGWQEFVREKEEILCNYDQGIYLFLLIL